MLFKFLKYTNPTWYFNLSPEKYHNYFAVEGQQEYVPDTNYISKIAAERDVAWRLFHEGKIGGKGEGINISGKEKIPVEDEYYFVRKYFDSYWSLYILLLRLLSFKNPAREIRSYLKSRKFKRSSYDFSEGRLTLEKVAATKIIDKPVISIIIPTLNRYQYLKDVLIDLENQTYKNFEVIIIDQSEPFNSDFYKGWALNMCAEPQKEKALWLARNKAIKRSKGDLILLYDDDSRVGPEWIEQHLRCLLYFNADISSGTSISTVGGRIPEGYRYFKWAEQLDTGNVLIKRHVFEKIGLFDRQFEKQRMGDGEFGLRAYLAGFRNINNPLAERLHLKAESGGLRQMGYWDEFRPKKLFAPRPIPSVLYLYRNYYGRAIAIQAILNGLPKSTIPYKFKKDRKKLAIGYFLALIFTPFLIVQVLLSWSRAGKMLKEGAKIEHLPTVLNVV